MERCYSFKGRIATFPSANPVMKRHHTVSVLYRPNFRLPSNTALNFYSPYVVTRYYSITTTEMKLLCASLIQSYGAVYALQVSSRWHVCHCGPCFRFYMLHIPFTHVSAFFMKHPQCNRHPVAHLQLQRQSVASFGADLIAISKISCNLSLWCLTMVANTTEIVMCYEERVQSMPIVPRLSHGRRMLRSDGGPNRLLLIYLFTDHSMATEFLKDIGLLRRMMQCNSCGRDMTWSVRSVSDRFVWQCQRRVTGAAGNQSTSIRHGSWFQLSRLTLQEIMLLKYIVCREPANHIKREYCFSDHTVGDWGMFCRETMLVFLDGCSVKIGGPKKTVKIDESKFGRRKYHRGHPVKGHLVFGGVERESGETFLVPIKD